MTTELISGERFRAMVALIAALATVSISSSLTWPILAESLRNQGYSETLIGLNASAQFIGIIVVAMAATTIIPRLGFYRVIMIGLALAAAMLLLLPTLRDYSVWFVFRFLLGIGNSLVFTAGDTWVNQIVEDRVRGRWMGIYSTVGMAGWAVGPILGSNLSPESYIPFLVGVGAVCIATCLLWPAKRIDVAFSRESKEDNRRNRLIVVFIAAPTVLLSAAMYGVVESSIQSFAHLYTMDKLGPAYRGIGYAVIWVGAIAAIFLQYPIGWLADRLDRGWLLVSCVTIMATSVAFFPFVLDGALEPPWSRRWLLIWIVVSIWGGAMAGIFTVGITLVGQRFHSIQLVAANAVFSLLFGIGGFVGPFMVGSSMEYLGPKGFPISLLIVMVAYAVFASYRQSTRSQRLAHKSST